MQDSQSQIPHILFLEDSALDAQLVEHELRRAGINFVLLVASSESEFLEGLSNFHPDLVLSDFSLPQFSGLEALVIVRREEHDIPFIMVTGSQSEEVAVECMREGATDYILKSNLMRLPTAVKNALKRSVTEKERAEALNALKKSQEQLLQAQKLEAVGRLAGGISHDFNNLLTAIMGYSELTLRELKPQDPLRRNLEEIRRASDRAASLTRQLLAFSRKQVMQLKVFDLNSVVIDLERMLRRMIGEDIDLRTTLLDGNGNIKADPGQIEQVIMNLVINARDAMPMGGKLTIETTRVYLDETSVQDHIEPTPGYYVMLAVSDTGFGVTDEVRQHMFEPFFTTKDPGKGTGLGLSTVYGIVKQLSGHIWVYSEPGKGTTFKVYFPAVIEAADDYKFPYESDTVPNGSETVLLVEDAEMVRNLAKDVLKSRGYNVLEADDGPSARHVCNQYHQSIDLLLTDVVMPRVSGVDLANELLRLHPEMRVLYMSGYTEDAIVNHGVLESGVNFIQKPFSADQLAIRVREVLDAKQHK
jgi:two-component system, cell cycle sensor histidine kinase and response regulator CckA